MLKEVERLICGWVHKVYVVQQRRGVNKHTFCIHNGYYGLTLIVLSSEVN